MAYVDKKRYFVFLLLTGLRPSEALAIKWSDINYEKGIIHIEHTLIRDNNLPKGERLTLGPTKEDTPKDISIDDIHILNILKDQQIYVKSLREKFGTEFKHPEIIFPSGKGNYRDLGALRKALNRVTEGTEFAFLTPHMFRHTFATIGLEESQDITAVSKELGHSSIETTSRFYAEVTPKTQKSLVNKVSSRIFGENDVEDKKESPTENSAGDTENAL